MTKDQLPCLWASLSDFKKTYHSDLSVSERMAVLKALMAIDSRSEQDVIIDIPTRNGRNLKPKRNAWR